MDVGLDASLAAAVSAVVPNVASLSVGAAVDVNDLLGGGGRGGILNVDLGAGVAATVGNILNVGASASAAVGGSDGDRNSRGGSGGAASSAASASNGATAASVAVASGTRS